jgi:hypothetical protein
MKIRNDFVTNSSSSSFIIAKKRGVKKQQIIDIIMNQNLEQFLNENGEWLDISDELDELDTIEEKKLLLAKTIVNGLTNSSELILGDWEVSAMEGSSEDSWTPGQFIFSYRSNIDTDIFKIVNCGS